jgi:maltose alpha-D-glucosyltransferase/alpha-amylase
MQWEADRTGGFSTAAPEELVKPMTGRGAYSPRKVNVHDQERDPASLLSWFERMIRTLRECPEVGVGTSAVVDVALPRSVLVHRCDAPEGSMVFLHNLSDRAVSVDLGKLEGVAGRPSDVFGDVAYPALGGRLTAIALNGWGYRWIRLRRSNRD